MVSLFCLFYRSVMLARRNQARGLDCEPRSERSSSLIQTPLSAFASLRSAETQGRELNLLKWCLKEDCHKVEKASRATSRLCPVRYALEASHGIVNWNRYRVAGSANTADIKPVW